MMRDDARMMLRRQRHVCSWRAFKMKRDSAAQRVSKPLICRDTIHQHALLLPSIAAATPFWRLV